MLASCEQRCLVSFLTYLLSVFVSMLASRFQDWPTAISLYLCREACLDLCFTRLHWDASTALPRIETQSVWLLWSNLLEFMNAAAFQLVQEMLFSIWGHTLVSLRESHRPRGATLVISFEADHDNAEYLRANFYSEIASGAVVVIEAQVWSESRMVRFSGRGLVGTVAPTGRLMRSCTVDEVVAELKVPCVNVVKADIEGAELHALKGASQMLGEVLPKLSISSYHDPEHRQLFTANLSKRPYRIYFDKGRKCLFEHAVFETRR